MIQVGLASSSLVKKSAGRTRCSFKKTIAAALSATLMAAMLSPTQVQAQVIPAIELDGGTGWIGTDKPLTLRELRGKFVILDFWTLC